VNQSIQQTTQELPNQSYALVRANKQWHRLTLPLTIGRHGDIMVNAMTLPEIAFKLDVSAEDLQLYHYQSQKVVSLDRIEPLGLMAWGPYPVIDNDGSFKTSVSIALKELSAKEDFALGSMPHWLRRISGCGLTYGRRWFARMGVMTTFIALLALGTQPKSMPDLSTVPFTLTFGTVHSTPIGASPSRPGYEQGILFQIDAPEDSHSHQHLLSFKGAGLNIDNEVELVLNDGSIFHSNADANCITSFCDYTIPLAAGLVKSGLNNLKLVHNPAVSAYFLSDLHLSKLDKTKPIELQQVQRWIQIAERHYNEREIVAENIVIAIDQLDKALEFLQTRESEPSTRDLTLRASVLKKEAQEAFAALVTDLWNRVKVNQKLEKNHKATKLLELLLRLYPNPTDSEHMRIKQNLTQIKEQSR